MSKKMLFVTVFAIVIGWGFAAQAEPNKPGPGKDRPRPQARMENAFSKLDLTPEQEKQVAPIMQQQSQQMRKIMHDPNLTMEQKQAAMKDLRTAYDAKLNRILTPEQQKKLVEMRTQSDAMPMGRGPMNDPQLTAEQKQAIAPILQKQRQGMMEIREDQTLSKEQRMEKIQALQKSTQEELSKHLTPEQAQRFSAPRQRPGRMGERPMRPDHKRPADSNA